MSGGQNLGNQISLRKKSARLLVETNNRLIHRPRRSSCPGGRFRTAKDGFLQNRRHDQYGRAANEIIPEVTDIRRREEDEHQSLRKERREKRCGPGDSTNKERCQEQTQDAAVEH